MDCAQGPLGWKGLVLIALALSSTGCFRHVPVQLETTAPGESVRVLTTRRGAAELADISDLSDDAPTIDGTFVGVEGQDLLLRVPVGRRQDGFISRDINQTIRIPTDEIVSFRLRELDMASTAFVVAGGVGLATAIVAFILQPHGRQPGAPDDSPDDALVEFRLFSFTLGR